MNFKKNLRYFSRFLILSGMFTAISMNGWSQCVISGHVLEKKTNSPLPGANIMVENTFAASTSDEKGSYCLQGLKKGSAYLLKVSYIGYEPIRREIFLRKDTTIDFTMSVSPILGEEVNIVATRVAPRTPATYSTLTPEKISEVNLGKDMPFILQSTPSVVVTSDAGTGIGYTGISIRGTDLTRINVTVNGIPANDAESQGMWFVDLPDLASSAQNIQVQRGVGTSTNGAGAFGATINIQTSSASKDPYGELNCSGGSYNSFKSTFRFGTGLLTNKFSVDGRVSFLTSDGYIDRASSKLKSFDISAGYFGKSTTLKFNILSGTEKTYQAWSGVPKDSLATNRTYNPSGQYIDHNGQIAYYNNQTDNYQQDNYQLLFSQRINSSFNLNAALHYTYGKGYYENYDPQLTLADYGLSDVIIGKDTIRKTDMIDRKMMENDFYGFTFSGNYQYQEKLKLTLGGAWNTYDGDHFQNVIWAQYPSNSDNNEKFFFNNGLKKDFNLFLKAQYRVLDRVNLFADMQYRHIRYRLNGLLDDNRTIDQLHLFDFYNPKAGIYVDITKRQNAYFSFGIANREPSRDNYKDADVNHRPTYETLLDYELGYNINLTSFTVSANLYYMRYHNQLALTGQINDEGEAIMVNVPRSYREGFELSAAADIMKWLKWNANATISRNKILNFTEYVDSYDADWNFTGQVTHSLGTTDLSFSPDLIFANNIIFIPVKNLSLTFNSRYVGRQYIDNTSNRERSLDPWFVHGITANYTMKTKVFREIGFNLSVNNIFSAKYETNAWVYPYYLDGKEYEENGYFPQAPVHFLFGISVKI
ncbi:MAG: TonB-dependent receptor, partial [Bacteroidota bacterium]|nr:TonB-dependent receptor [Bacteroidota bacterium]